MPASRLLAAAGLYLASLPAMAGPPEGDVRAAIARALPFVRDGGKSWIEERKCVSCHHVAFTTWALEAAQDRGFDVDSEQLAEWRKWSRDSLVELRDDGKTVGSTNLEGVSQILWAERDHAPGPPASNTAFLDMLVAGQRDDGSWSAGGQLPDQKRPEAETEAASTAWNALALGTAQGPSYEAAREKALAFLATQPDGVSTEIYAARLLLAVQSGEPVEEPLRNLLSHQRSDGGWGWVTTDDSDALATGMALYALRYAGVPPADPHVARAVTLLVSTQNADGSWSVRGTKKNKKDHVEATATYWGTCWAVIALSSVLPEAS